MGLHANQGFVWGLWGDIHLNDNCPTVTIKKGLKPTLRHCVFTLCYSVVYSVLYSDQDWLHVNLCGKRPAWGCMQFPGLAWKHCGRGFALELCAIPRAFMQTPVKKLVWGLEFLTKIFFCKFAPICHTHPNPCRLWLEACFICIDQNLTHNS